MLLPNNIASIFILSSFLAACAGNGTHHMTQDQLLTDIQNKKAPIIVDVRTDSEYQSGHVPGAVHLPFYSLWSRHTEINSKTGDPIILYCEHGPRAGIAKFALWTLGYSNLVYLEGHMSDWKGRELPMTKETHDPPY